MLILRLLFVLLFVPAFLLGATTTRRFARELRIVLFLGFLTLVAVLVIHPVILESIAQVMGVNSALDLVVFVITVGLLTLGFYVNSKFERQQEKLSALASKYALLEFQIRSRDNKDK